MHEKLWKIEIEITESCDPFRIAAEVNLGPHSTKEKKSKMMGPFVSQIQPLFGPSKCHFPLYLQALELNYRFNLFNQIISSFDFMIELNQLINWAANLVLPLLVKVRSLYIELFSCDWIYQLGC